MADLVFLDHGAGSPLRPEVAAAMSEAMIGLPPNPSGAHRLARATRGVLEDARDRVAALLGVPSRAVLFTGGGTESCNLALLAAPGASAVVISAVEHASVRQAALARSLGGPELIELEVTELGALDLETAVAQIPEGALVSIMAANNETGVLQPVLELVERLGARREAITLHVDAVAAAACIDLAPLAAAADLVSLAAHKLGGPPGTGVLVATGEIDLVARSYGGGQERGIRVGTQDVAGAVGMAAALEHAVAEQLSGAVRAMGERRDSLAAALGALDAVTITAPGAARLESHLHLTVRGARSEELLLLADAEGICAAAGAACASGAPQASRVLLAMGLDEAQARGALRLTLATSTTEAELARGAAVLEVVIARLGS